MSALFVTGHAVDKISRLYEIVRRNVPGVIQGQSQEIRVVPKSRTNRTNRTKLHEDIFSCLFSLCPTVVSMNAALLSLRVCYIYMYMHRRYCFCENRFVLFVLSGSVKRPR